MTFPWITVSIWKVTSSLYPNLSFWLIFGRSVPNGISLLSFIDTSTSVEQFYWLPSGVYTEWNCYRIWDLKGRWHHSKYHGNLVPSSHDTAPRPHQPPWVRNDYLFGSKLRRFQMNGPPTKDVKKLLRLEEVTFYSYFRVNVMLWINITHSLISIIRFFMDVV